MISKTGFQWMAGFSIALAEEQQIC